MSELEVVAIAYGVGLVLTFIAAYLENKKSPLHRRREY